jgi:hypothetical protein
LAWFLLSGPAWAVDLTKIATIPKGQIHFDEGVPVGDADSDGRPEVYFEQSLPPFSLNVWENWGSSSYQPVFKRDGCHPIAGGDVDGDGISDLLCAWGPQAFLLESRHPAVFPRETVWAEPLGGFPGIRGYFADADRDGQQEMWIVPNDPDVIEVWENRGDDTYVQVALLAEPALQPGTLAFRDFDGDGATEIVVGGSLNNLFVWENNGDDSYDQVWTFEFPDQQTLHLAAARDLDGDGRPEFLVSGTVIDTFDHRVVVFEASGDNAYEPIWQVQGGGHLIRTYLAIGDVDGDRVEEFAVGSPDKIEVFKAKGDNDFGLIETVPYPDDHAIALADLNGNGYDELIFNGDEDGGGTAVAIHIYELADIQPPVLVPAFYPTKYWLRLGEVLNVNAELFNRTDIFQIVDVWLEIYQGDGQGGPQGRLLEQNLVAGQQGLAPKKSITWKQSIPLPAKPATYTVQLKVGTFPDQVTDTRWFSVEVRQGT